MKNKKSLYILIPLVLMVWGIIGYRIWAHIGSDDIEIDMPSSNMPSLTDLNIDADTFYIKNNYTDPFLKHSFVVNQKLEQVKQTNNRKSNKTQNRIMRRRQLEAQRIQWPEIIYSGLITNEKDNSKTILVSINGKQQLMKPYEEFNGVKLIKIYNDSIRIGFKEQEKSIIKNMQQQL